MPQVVDKSAGNEIISGFQKYLSVWVLICMVVGVALGQLVPELPAALAQMQVAGISIPMAILIWVMVYPMMMKVDFKSVRRIGKNPKGLFVTWGVNWLVRPFSMYLIASTFLLVVFRGLIPHDLATQYLAGAALLGTAPCTAMVFVWSKLVKGDPAYTVVQVATNDLIVLVAYAPIAQFLLGVSNVVVPVGTLVASVVLFVAIPLVAGVLTRTLVMRRRGADYFEETFVHRFDRATTAGLLLTLVMIFMGQSVAIVSDPVHIVLIAVPLILQTLFIWVLSYGLCWAFKVPHEIAGPASMIGSSNFFELSVAVAASLLALRARRRLLRRWASLPRCL